MVAALDFPLHMHFVDMAYSTLFIVTLEKITLITTQGYC